MHYKLTGPYSFGARKQPVNSLCRDRKGPIQPRTAKYDARAGFLQILVMSILLCVHKGAVRHPCGSHTGPYEFRRTWKTSDIPVRGLYDARTGISQDPCGVPWIIRSNHKCTPVSNCTGTVAWCHHENSTGVKFLWAFHSALWARNRTGDKNRMGPVVGCDWGISSDMNGSLPDWWGNIPIYCFKVDGNWP